MFLFNTLRRAAPVD